VSDAAHSGARPRSASHLTPPPRRPPRPVRTLSSLGVPVRSLRRSSSVLSASDVQERLGAGTRATGSRQRPPLLQVGSLTTFLSNATSLTSQSSLGQLASMDSMERDKALDLIPSKIESTLKGNALDHDTSGQSASSPKVGAYVPTR
jgi:hypothetical protein